MGSWGITMRQSDYGLDLLGTIVDTKLKEADFATFNMTDALEVIKADIMEEIRQLRSHNFYITLQFVQENGRPPVVIAAATTPTHRRPIRTFARG